MARSALDKWACGWNWASLLLCSMLFPPTTSAGAASPLCRRRTVAERNAALKSGHFVGSWNKELEKLAHKPGLYKGWWFDWWVISQYWAVTDMFAHISLFGHCQQLPGRSRVRIQIKKTCLCLFYKNHLKRRLTTMHFSIYKYFPCPIKLVSLLFLLQKRNHSDF